MALPRISHVVPVDLDFPKETLPALSSCPFEGETCNDRAYIQTVDAGGRGALRVQFNSEVPGLWGRKGGGWSRYAIYLEGGGKIYARQAFSGDPKEDSKRKYNLNHPDWTGAPRRVAQIIAEAVAGWEMRERLSSPSEIMANPYYRLGVWLKNQPDSVFEKGIPDPRLHAVPLDEPVTLPMDLDDNSAAGFLPSAGLVNVAASMTNDRVQLEKKGPPDFPIIEIRFASEVPVRELGRRRSEISAGPDPWAEAVFSLSSGGIAIFYAPSRGTLRYEPTLPKSRLILILASALIAAGNHHQPLERAESLYRRAPKVTTEGEDLPGTVRFAPGSALQILSEMSPAEAATNMPVP